MENRCFNFKGKSTAYDLYILWKLPKGKTNSSMWKNPWFSHGFPQKIIDFHGGFSTSPQVPAGRSPEALPELLAQQSRPQGQTWWEVPWGKNPQVVCWEKTMDFGL